jgi:hypothetical protein
MRTPDDLRKSIDKRTQPGANGCLIWTGALDSDGYPKINVGREVINGPDKRRQVHRVNWELINGPVPAGYELARHGCTNRRCIEPLHLTLNEYKGKAGRIAQDQNIDPTVYRCGHDRTPENTYLSGDYPYCKTCSKARSRERCRRWRARHPDKTREYNETRRTAHKTGIAA